MEDRKLLGGRGTYYSFIHCRIHRGTCMSVFRCLLNQICTCLRGCRGPDIYGGIDIGLRVPCLSDCKSCLLLWLISSKCSCWDIQPLYHILLDFMLIESTQWTHSHTGTWTRLGNTAAPWPLFDQLSSTTTDRTKQPRDNGAYGRSS